MILRTCADKACKKPFVPVKPWQRFDTKDCRNRHHNRLKQAILKKAAKNGRAKS